MLLYLLNLDQSNGDRNPTEHAAWYSLPGSCPTQPWTKKNNACLESFPGGRCATGIPDGVLCTWSSRLLGQVSLDELSGLTQIINPATKLPFVNATEFCMAGGIEFERDARTFEFVDGLEFWKAPLSEAQNKIRIARLLELYTADRRNEKLPLPANLRAKNPRCFSSSPGCFDVQTQEGTCVRNDEMKCLPCDQVEGGCEEQDIKGNDLAFPMLDPVEWALDSPTDSDKLPGKTRTGAGVRQKHEEQNGSEKGRIALAIWIPVVAIFREHLV